MPILEISNADSGYGEVQFLWGASLKLEEGKLTSLVGGNGVGKTTLLRAAMGLTRLWRGSILFEGRDVSNLPAHAKAEMGLVMGPEGRQLFTDMTVAENLEMGAAPARTWPETSSGFTRCSRACASAPARKPERSAATSSRCWRWRAASWPNPRC
jgi:branched-chain amino acid transport system ATP-binding protein